MARPIKETPILFGNDARQFERRMAEKRIETSSARESRLRDFNDCMTMLNAGSSYHLANR